MRRLHARRRQYRRREILGLLGAGLLLAIGAEDRRQRPRPQGTGPGSADLASSESGGPPARGTRAGLPPPQPVDPTQVVLDAEGLPPFPPPRPGPATVVSAGRSTGRQIAITIDDGTSEECVEAYVEFAERTGVALTFSPNGAYRSIWSPRAARLAPLISAGQVQIANHTWSHPDLRRLPDARIEAEITQNESWIQDTFGVTGRPWFRPPFGSRTPHTDDVAAGLGYTQILMWNGTFGDATVESPAELMDLARRYLQPGVIMLGHANHPTITRLFDQIQQLLNDRDLDPVTLDTMFGSSRSRG